MSAASTPPNNKKALLNKNVVIPPRPEALTVLKQEVVSEEPDVDIVIAALKKDPGLFAAILQVVNSPVFGLSQKVTTIEQGVALLGLDKVVTISRSAAVRSNLSEPKCLSDFWDICSEVADICGLLTSKLTGEDATYGYTIGMFHSCGIPVLNMALRI
ncbi:MAG: HDOD domain-containing protein [Cellvibrionaceae bacterium]